MNSTLKLAIISWAVLACFISFAVPSAAQARIEGSCEGYYQEQDAIGSFSPIDRSITRNGVIPVMVSQTPILKEPTSDAERRGTFRFNDRLNPVAESADGKYIQVRHDTRPGSPVLGWVAANNVLCRARALRTPDGVSRKFYIRTAANAEPDSEVAVVPTASPTSDECAELNGLCQNLTRFLRFYIMAEDRENQKILLSASSLAEALTPLNGWVSSKDGYRWNTRLGFRPADNLVVDNVTGALRADGEVIACVYEKDEEALAAKNEDTCNVPVLGGPRWFNSSIRLPVLGSRTIGKEEFYEIAVPVAGVGAQSRGALLEQVAGLDNAIRALQGLKNLDVFFLIDGTQSMEPHIEALVGSSTRPGVIQNILDSIEGDPRFATVRPRFGFRVYRDTYAGKFGIGDGLALDRNCEPTDEDLARNRQVFDQLIRKIDTKFTLGETRDPDDEEALIVALTQAVVDVSFCENNVKLLFVIGDTGYDSDALVERGVPKSLTDEEEVVGHLVNGVSARSIDPIIPFFIHVPEAADALRRTGNARTRYLEAYKKFETQAHRIITTIGRIYQDSQRVPVQLSVQENFFSLNPQREAGSAQPDYGSVDTDIQQRLLRTITDQVALFGDQRPVNEIIAGLQTGEALVEIITALQTRASGVPALRLAQIERRICDTLGEACTEKIVSDTQWGLVRKNEIAQIDVLVTADELDDWRSLLDPLRDTTNMTIPQQSELIIMAITKGLERSLGELTPHELDMPLSDFLLLKAALPSSSQTPLMNYSLRDFIFAAENSTANPDEGIESCEIYNVIRWLSVRRDIFREINDGNVPIVDRDLIDPIDCEMRHDEVESLVFRDFKKFPDESMNYSFVETNARWFWIPNEMLP